MASRAGRAVRAAVRRQSTWIGVSRPARVVVASFCAVILVGTILLALPVASNAGQWTPVIDAFFTAVSATCVTGLVVVDTGSHYSIFGQVVILSCIQVGGLGLMTFTTVYMVATGRRLAISDRIAIQESFHHSPTGKVGKLVLYIVVATFATEFLGTAMLFARWLQTGQYASVGAALYSAMFHSISAFCNAGFSTDARNAARFRDDPVTLGILSGLVIAGGLGFLVGLDVKEYVQQYFGDRWWPYRVRERVHAIRPRPRLSLHTKLVLITTAALLIVGSVSFYALERGGALRHMNLLDAAANAWFCSVTARTAGFNTVDYSRLGSPALLCTMVLMFIGASPGSAGGGVKTSTFAVLTLNAFQRWRGYKQPRAFGRSIPRDAVDRANTVVVAAVALFVLAASVVMAVEAPPSNPAGSQGRFLSVVFETISAFGTVGLSMGITPSLSIVSKIAISAVMFIGRIGPLSLAVAIARNDRRVRKFVFAEENVMIG